MYIGLHVKYPLFLSVQIRFSLQIFRILQISNFVKIRPLCAKSFHVDGRTDGYDEANSCFCIFTNACKSEIN
jgi:hypothetical protein